jgi:hypothetical protein
LALKTNAGDDAAGEAMISQRSNARLKSSAIAVRAFCALT